ncbi:DNA (cytosine-5)-methyltransferase CMT3 [Andrographis paniculata]|uniref:DNA (cytosine-5)-methyltransferase CMT3 n=1 Tax=Andrographis paniculata TaxID=175694 RepID=UPI0021E8BB95|nr:DNA (cytosine-5)-methyltransferase CMT3 [Andrographis paniculata]
MPKRKESASSNSQGQSKKAVSAPPEVEDAVEMPENAAGEDLKLEGEEDEVGEVGQARFLGDPIPVEEAKRRWPHRYTRGQSEFTQARGHYSNAEVDGVVFSLDDEAYVQAEPGKDSYICKIVEFFSAVDGSLHFTAQWYYRAGDTVIQSCTSLVHNKQIFFSEIRDDNPLDCLVKKINIKFIPSKEIIGFDPKTIPTWDFYYSKKYLLPYTSFVNMPSDDETKSQESTSTISSDRETSSESHDPKNEISLLDLYSGCGAMSTGLCLGANIGGVRLVTKWAVDYNQYACESLKLNHPETEVRNESAEDFLHLIEEWEKLCSSFSLSTKRSSCNEMESNAKGGFNSKKAEEEEEAAEDDDDAGDSEIYEVEEILGICHGDPNNHGKSELHFKIRWKGYGPEEDTWEPLEGLSDCKDKLKEFVTRGYESKLLPLPGSVGVICGGPPCQGISGFNRFRNKEAPLEDPKNKQLKVYVDIVDFLKPRFVLMENVVDMVKFAGGFLGRYALGRLVSIGYQVRMGMMAAGSYGLPQFRMRVFMWGALPTENLPQYPLPTHEVANRGVNPTEFEMNAVNYDEGCEPTLKPALFLKDAIADLPAVGNKEERDEMPYTLDPESEFQKFIRRRRDEMPGCLVLGSISPEHSLYDHVPYRLNQDDYDRVCQVPKKKGANFRNFPGVRVRPDNKVEWDPDIERVYLKSGKPLVPDYAMTFVRGTSSKPFGRLWWDEIVSTVVTRPEPHNHALLHPEQDRVLTVRENARLQGFPDYYKLTGPVKERYMQVGNAVAVPVARALGYSLASALKGSSGSEPVMKLPENFPFVPPPA